MKTFGTILLAFSALSISAQSPAPSATASNAHDSMTHMTVAQPASAAPEHLGTVSFPVSCSPSAQMSFNRGVALLHDFWYSEAKRQFEQIAKADPGCAMAHWGVAMSQFHQIWARPDDGTMKAGRAEMQKAQSPQAKTEREREYIGALTTFFVPGKEDFQPRIEAYAAAMAKLSKDYPEDVDAGAFYALSVLAAERPDDTSLAAEHSAMAILVPLSAKYPDNPGVVHYIIHSCDNPAMAQDGLAAADHYGEIAPSGAHAFHMPGHIYARLGMWPQDIASNAGSVAAAESAEKKGEGGLMDEPHSYDFLLYAYLQSGQDASAQAVINQLAAVMAKIDAMPDMANHHMVGMVPYYRTKAPVFYALEMREWKAAAAIQPPADSPPQVAVLAYWARIIANGHLHQPEIARANLVKYDALIAEVKKGKRAYMADSTGAEIEHHEVLAWVAFAESKQEEALKYMREAADLQDKVGQGEVDIPAREMLADMLLELHRPKEALAEYAVAIKLSPNRFNGLFNAGRAAEEAGDKAKANQYYAALLKSTDNGSKSARPEFAHAKSFVTQTQLAAK